MRSRSRRSGRADAWTRIVVALTAIGWCSSCVLEAGPAQPAAPARAAAIDQAFQKLLTYKFGDSRAPLTAVADAVRNARKPKDRKDLERRLAAVLGSKATADGKQFACRQLRIIGSGKSVPALSKLLDDEALSHMARYALEQMQAPEAGAALRQALGRTGGKLRVGVINSLGERRDVRAVGSLVGLLGADEATAAASAGALGKIGGTDALKALAAVRAKASPKLRPVVTDAYLLAADGLLAAGKKREAGAVYEQLYAPAEPREVRVAALRGLAVTRGAKAAPLVLELLRGDDPQMRAAAARCARELPGKAATKAFAAALDKLPPQRRVQLLDALGDRGDPAARDAVVAAAAAGDQPVRVAAARALGGLGGAACVPVLLKLSGGKGAEAGEAARSLDRLRGADVDRAMLDLLGRSDPPARRTLLGSLGRRGAKAAIPAMLKASADPDAETRQAAVEALGRVAGEKELPALIGLYVNAPKGGRDAPRKAFLSACGRVADKDRCAAAVLAAMGKPGAPARAALYGLLGRVHSRKALKALRAAAGDKDPAVRDAAIRALAAWPDPAPAADLLAIARAAENETHRILALRGYVRMAGIARPKTDKLLRMYKDALAVANRPAERKLVLAPLGHVRDVRALKMVLPFVEDKAVGAEAVAAAMRLITRYLAKSHPKESAQALEKIVQAARDPKVRKQAQQLLDKVRKTLKPAREGRSAPAPRPPVVEVLAFQPLAAAAEKKEGKVEKQPYKPPERDPAKVAAVKKLGWRLGVQAYSFKRFTFFQAVEKTASLGLKCIEGYPGQRLCKQMPKVRFGHGMSPEARAATRKKLADSGVKLVCYGVVGLSNSEKAARGVFNFAREMGIETIVCEPSPAAGPVIEGLANEYGVNLAIHNHPKPSRYWSPEKVLAFCKGRSKRVGACADTGHWMRSALDPVESLKKLAGRVVSLHFKDLSSMNRGHDVPWGTGKGNVKAMLEVLARQRFRGVFSIEYEHNWDNSVPDMAKCVAYFDQVAADLVEQLQREALEKL